ncbi:MAG: 50S ribosomal protein L9 [Bacteriovoracaceae bacterium]|nr:50S ribosomal protein L9 [Bacteriovoracaceae bacterium]
MKVILTERVSTLGDVGEIVKVSAGHARNFLLPKKLAVLADEANQRQLANQQRRLRKKIEAQKAEAEALKKQIDVVSLELIKKVGANGKLFGSVTNQELANELENRGIKVDRRRILFDSAIKTVGNFNVRVKLFTDVEAAFKVKVTMDPKQVEELKAQEAAAKAAKAAAKKKAEEAKAAAASTAEAGQEEKATPEE